jgi:hypothetical protein
MSLLRWMECDQNRSGLRQESRQESAHGVLQRPVNQLGPNFHRGRKCNFAYGITVLPASC